jgi:hypothetical protein
MSIYKTNMNMFAIYHLSGIKKSKGTKLAEWLQMKGREIFIEKSNTPITFVIELGSRFYTKTENDAKFVLQFDSLIMFLENFHHEEHNSLILIMKRDRISILHRIGNSVNSFSLSDYSFMANSFKNSHKRRLYQIYSRIPIESNRNNTCIKSISLFIGICWSPWHK